MKYIASVLLLALFGLQASAQMHGNYAVNRGKKASSGYQLLKIHAKESGSLLFYLEVGRGAPDYNSGSLYGKLTYNSKTDHYEYIPKNTTDDCKLVFIKTGKTIIIKTVAGDCPFGYGVEADGKYLVIDHINPKFFIDRKGRKIYFDKTAPGYLF